MKGKSERETKCEEETKGFPFPGLKDKTLCSKATSFTTTDAAVVMFRGSTSVVDQEEE